MTTVTTTTTTTTGPALSVAIDRTYPKTLFGMLNITLLVLNFICIICALSLGWIPGGGWFYFVCTTGFFLVLINFLLGLCRVQHRLVHFAPWRLGVLIARALWTIFYLVAASCALHAAINYLDRSGWFAAGFFGFGAMFVYAFSSYHLYLDWKGTPAEITVTVA